MSVGRDRFPGPGGRAGVEHVVLVSSIADERAVHLGTMGHLADTSRARGLDTSVPDLFGSLLERAEAGHGADGVTGVTGAITKGGRNT
ncbi:hypothetical protein [Streptomyces finlayi]|uniref:imine reductase family protein n=1 Tax=Streptomyces finlayi TaxID=67296 RepID=UPI00167ADFA9|nr:hypothetical protein [Streptomyces finlayi]